MIRFDFYGETQWFYDCMIGCDDELTPHEITAMMMYLDYLQKQRENGIEVDYK